MQVCKVWVGAVTISTILSVGIYLRNETKPVNEVIMADTNRQIALGTNLTVTWHVTRSSNISTTTESSQKEEPIRRSLRHITLLLGWANYYEGMPPTKLSCVEGKYNCAMQATTIELTPNNSDVVVFHEGGMLESPPVKYPGQLWVFRTGESQQSLRVTHMENYDNLFNYTIDHREDATKRAYVRYFEKLEKPLARNFSGEKLDKLKRGILEANVLWFVSNCAEDGYFKVKSGRAEYVSELSRWINISIYTRMQLCKRNSYLKPLIKEKVGGMEPRELDFTFYLAFENILCKDYITEKLWKILTNSEHLMIPVVMGGLSAEDYQSIAPPNSYIDVRNFTSPKHLAEHLKYVAADQRAFNYYHQWRNNYGFVNKGNMDSFCQYCVWAWEQPHSVVEDMGHHFNRSQCLDMSHPKDNFQFYNLSCQQQKELT